MVKVPSEQMIVLAFKTRSPYNVCMSMGTRRHRQERDPERHGDRREGFPWNADAVAGSGQRDGLRSGSGHDVFPGSRLETDGKQPRHPYG